VVTTAGQYQSRVGEDRKLGKLAAETAVDSMGGRAAESIREDKLGRRDGAAEK